jgi:PKHD-type hydroxylase
MDIEPEADQKSQRKLSVTILLNNPNEFKGGELELKLGDENLKAELAKGSMAFFPSFSLHRITKVTEGTRWAAVAWFRGPRFR